MRTIAILLVVLLAGVSQVSQAQTWQNINVPINTVRTITKTESPVFVNSLSVYGTLNVEAGVELVTGGSTRFAIYHTARVYFLGTETQRIRVRPIGTGWSGIENFMRSSMRPVLRVSYTDFENMQGIGSGNAPGIRLWYADAIFHNCTFSMPSVNARGLATTALQFLGSVSATADTNCIGEVLDCTIIGAQMGINNSTYVDVYDVTIIGANVPYQQYARPVRISVEQ